MKNGIFLANPVLLLAALSEVRTSPPRRHSADVTGPIAAAALVWMLGALCWIMPVTFCLAAPLYGIKQTPPLRYVEEGTWFDSMLASRAALHTDESAGRRPKPKVSLHSGVVRGRQPAQAIAVPTQDVAEIYLYVTGASDVEYGAADWIAPRAIDAEGNPTRLCSGKFLDLQEGFHTVDCSLRSRVDPPLRIADKEYPHGAVRFHVTDAAGAARLDLWTRLTVEFSAKKPRKEMKWEREDRLLEEDWKSGDWRTLAWRYAEASGRVASLQSEARGIAEKVNDRASFDRVRAIYHSRPNRAHNQRGRRLFGRHLCRSRTSGDTARNRKETAGVHLPFRLPKAGGDRASRRRRWPVGNQTDSRDGAR